LSETRQERNARLKTKLVEMRANKERFRGGYMTFTPAPYEVQPEKPGHVVRAVYGPVMGLASSSIVAYTYDPELLKQRTAAGGEPLQFVDDGFGHWGPREFLFALFQLVANLHGDCVVYMVHSGEEIGIDAASFEAWVRSTNENPVGALMQARALLEQRDG